MKQSKINFRRTKIVCTMGPASGSAAQIERLVLAGMDIARLNLSHGTPERSCFICQYYTWRLRHLGAAVSILMDLPGPKYRTGKLESNSVDLVKDSQLGITTRDIEGDGEIIPVNLATLPENIQIGDTVLLDDGSLQLKVLEKGRRTSPAGNCWWSSH